MEKRRALPKDRLYIAYGSNLNLGQMARRCPTAEIAGKAVLRNWKLAFRGVATIERCTGHTVPVLVWRLQPKDERSLDAYEGWPHLYRKETLRITMDGERAYAMAYVMNEARRPYSMPSKGYLQTILEGYEQAGFNEGILWQAVADSVDEEERKWIK